mgnify:CR=1 FL=1
MKLPIEKRKMLLQLQKEIDALEQQGESNINEDHSKAEFKISELDGIPPEAIARMKRVEGKPDTVYLKVDKKKLLLAIKLCKNVETKKKLDLLHDNIGKEKNVPIMNALIQKRD